MPGAMQGNRVKRLCCDKACENVVIPRGGLSSGAQGVSVYWPSQQVTGHMLDHCDVCGSIFGPDAAFIIAKHHIHDPVEAIFDRPVTADDQAEEMY